MAGTANTTASNPKGNNFALVLHKEHEAIRERRRAFDVAGSQSRGTPKGPKADDPPAELFGIALSGGGIRSSCFCLGALQALDQCGLLRRADYLSTVSGGGYIGASMVAAMTVKESTPAAGQATDVNRTRKTGSDKEWGFPFPAGVNSDVRDSEAVSHIRDNSRFLAPRGLYDVGISIAILLRGLAVNFILLLGLLLPLALVIILANPTTAHLEHSILLDLANFMAPVSWESDWWWTSFRSLITDPFIISKVAAVVLALWLAGWALWRSHVERFAVWEEAAPLEQESAGSRVGRALFIWLVIALIVEVQPLIIDALSAWLTKTGASGNWFKLAAAAVTSLMAITATFQATLVVWIQRALNIPTLRARLQALVAKAAFYALGLALPLAIYGFFLLLVIWGIKAPCPSSGCYPYAPEFLVASNWTLALILLGCFLVLVVLRRIFFVDANQNIFNGRISEALGALRRRNYSGPILTAIAGCLVGLPLAAFATRATATHWFQGNDEWIVLVNYLLLTANVLIIGVNFTENANGLHRLYRDRLRVAFRLGRADGTSLPLHELGEQSPYLLINATLNVRRPKEKSADTAQSRSAPKAISLPAPDPAKRGRNAEFFLLSRHFIGSESTGYADSAWMWVQQPELDLAAATAISGAAVSSSMGRIGIGLLGPTLALLNLRLGFWLPNPADLANSRKSWEDIFRLYLFAEAFGRLRSDSSRIYITDGGHIDNIGLYQLLKRKCKYIVVVDAEADPGMNFSAFADVQRFARIDEGALISLDWWPVRTAALKRLADRSKEVPRDSKAHKQHFALGRIVYEGGQEGMLLYVKATVTGDEPDYVLDYERRYPNFPHEATSDQFFSEEQMEAYRALGYHATQIALRDTKGDFWNALKPQR